MALIHMTRTLSGLSPADDHARKVLGKIALGATVGVEYRQPRNGPMHKRYWALMQMILNNSEQYGSVEQVSDHVKCLSGHCTVVCSQKTGEALLVPKSISFSNMDQAEFEDFWDRVVKVIVEHILPGVTVPQIEEELLQLIGGASWR